MYGNIILPVFHVSDKLNSQIKGTIEALGVREDGADWI